MSGGVAYVLDDIDELRIRTNLGTVELESLSETEDIELVHQLVKKHAEFTGSSVAKALLADWPRRFGEFVRVMPTDYKRVLLEQRKEKDLTPVLAKS
jgi:glutamate synthase domain-containing protein 3